jgi:DNA-3-methyladenine glycosylase I
MAAEANVVIGDDGVARCFWGASDPLYRRYHDTEWGRPTGEDRALFEKLSLEGFQAGLSWLTILRKRDNFRRAFASFNIQKVARFTTRSVDRLMTDAGIVRNRAKIEATINNARRCLDLIDEFGSLAGYAWSYEPDDRSRPTDLDWATLVALPPDPQARAMSKDLKRRGWFFVGPTTVYSFMEAMGMVNDHIDGCDRRGEIEALRRVFVRPRLRAFGPGT